MRKVLPPIAILLFTLVLASCTKQKEAETRAELLTAERWNIYQVHQTVWVNDSLAFDETEELNSTASFDNSSRTVTISSPQEGTRTYSWGFFEDQLQIGDDLHDIETLTKTEMILSLTTTENDPDLGVVRTRNRLFFKH